jgi:hypothetical protein
MQVERRQTIGIAAGLPIELLPIAHIEKAVVVGFYFRIEIENRQVPPFR